MFLIGSVINSFNENDTDKFEMVDSVNELCLIFSLVGVGVFVMSYLYSSFLLIASERIVKQIKLKYLASILKQESAWFDTNNPAELSARVNKECLSMQRAIGEKMGAIIMAFAMTIAGLSFAFIKGWSFSLVVMGAFPFIFVATTLLSKVMQQGFRENMKAYG